MVIGFSAICRFATGAPCTRKCPVAPESDMAYSTACFNLVVLKIVPALGSSWSSCCVTMEFQAHCAHRLFGKKLCNHLVNLFRFLTFRETTWDGHIEYVDRFLALFCGNSSLHADIIFTKICFADVGRSHGLIIIIFQCGKVVGVVVPCLIWDMPFRNLKFRGRALDWLQHDWSLYYRLHRHCLWTSIGSEDACLVI